MDVPEYRNCTCVVISSMNCSTYLSVSIISSYRNLSKPHIERYSFADNIILGNNKNITFHYCHQKETSAHVCTTTSSVKGTASKQMIQPVSTIAASVSAVYASTAAAALDGSKHSGLNLRQYLFPQDGALPSEPSMISLKSPSCSESARASLTAIASANTSHRGSGCGGVSLRGRKFLEKSGGLIPQDGYLPFDPSMRSPKPPSCLDSARSSLTTRDSAIASTIHRGSGSGGVSLIG